MSVHSIRIDSECGNEFPSEELEFISGKYLYGYRESQSKMANHPTAVVGSDDLNRIISGFVPQQDNVLTQCKTREMAYCALDSDSQMKPVKIFDLQLQVRSDPNVVNAFKWRKHDRTITTFVYVNDKFNTRKVIPTSFVVCGDNLYAGENDDMRKHLRGYYYLCACCVPSSVPPIAVSDDSIDTVTFGCYGNSQTYGFDTRSSHGLHNDLCHPPNHHGVARSYTPVLSYNTHLPNFIVGFGYYFTVHFDGTSPSSSHFVCDHVTKSTLQSFNSPIYPKMSVCFNGFNVLLKGLPISETQVDNTVVYAVPYTSEDMCGIVSTVMSSSSCFDVMINVNGETYGVGSHHKLNMQLSVHPAAEVLEECMLLLIVDTRDSKASSDDMSTDITATTTKGVRRFCAIIIVNDDKVKSFGVVFSCHLHAITYARLVGKTRDATVLRDDGVEDICLNGNALERISADRLSSYDVWVWFDTTTTTSCHGIGVILVKRSALIGYRTGMPGIADCIIVAWGARVKSPFEACEHNTAWNTQALSSVMATSAVVICASTPCTIILSRRLLQLSVQLQSLDVYLRIVLHSCNMHYSHCLHCAIHNDGGDSSCAQLLLIIFGHNLCRLGSVYSVKTHDGSIIVQAHDESLMCLLIKPLNFLSICNKSLIQYTTGTSDTILVVTFYRMDCMIGSLALTCAVVMARQICFCCNCFVGINNISAIYYGGNISSLQMVIKYGESSYILSHKRDDVCSASIFVTEVESLDISFFDLSRSHEKKVLIITVRSHHSVLHHLCRLVCLGRNKVNGESSAMDSSIAYWSQFVSYIEVFSYTATSWRARNGQISYVDYFSIPRENGELANCSIKPKECGQHNAYTCCAVVLTKHEETTVCSIDTQHPLHCEIALQIGFFMLIVCLVTIPTVNHPSLHSSLRKQTGCHCTTADVRRSSCNSRSNQDALQSGTTTRAILNLPYGASTRFMPCTNEDASSTTPATSEVTHVLSSAQFPGLIVRRFDEFDPETRKVALTSQIIDGINEHFVSVYTDNSVLTHVTEGHIEDGKRGAYNWEEEWGEYICKDGSGLQVSLRIAALALLVGCRFVTSCVPTWRDVVSYICETLYDGSYNDSVVDSSVNTMAYTTNRMLCDGSCNDVKTCVGAKSYDLSCERFLCYDLSGFLKILWYRMDMLMRRYIMKYMKFVLGKRRSHMLNTDLDMSFGNALLVLHPAFSYGRLYYSARSTSQRCIFSMASSSKILLRRETLLIGNNISSAFYGTTLPYWRVRKLLQALACWFTTICNTTIMLNYGEHIIAASIGCVSVVYDLLLALFKFILYYRNNRFDFTRIDRWGVSHNFDFRSGLCRNGSIRYVELLVRTRMSLLYERVYGGISTEMTTLSSFTK